MEKKKILVTGGTGFTGSHLVRRLLSRGHEVAVIDNQEGLFFDELTEKGAKITIGSVTEKALLESLIPGCEIIYHLAAAFRKINVSNQHYTDVNEGGMRLLLEIAKANEVKKVVYCSTQGVHGNVDPFPGNEDSPIAPEDFYQFTKYKGEEVCAEFVKDGMDITILRPTAIYGPGDPGRFLMMYRQVEKGFFPFFGKGEAYYHPLYIDNFIDAFELAAEKPEGKGRTYLIADDEYFYIKDIVGMIADIMGVKLKVLKLPFWLIYWISAVVEVLFKPLPMDPPLFRRRADWFRQNRGFSIDRVKNELGYQPKVSLKEGLTRTYEWYRDNGYLKSK